MAVFIQDREDALSVKTDNKSMAVFILKTHNQTNYKMFAQVRLNGQCVLSIKTAIIM